MQVRPTTSGITLIEVIVAVSITAVILMAVGLTVNSYVTARSELIARAQALYLAEEGYEFLRFLRDENWNTISALTLDTPYYFSVTSADIAITTTPETINGFNRQFIVSEIERDGDDDITFSGTGTADDESLLVTISVGGPIATTSLEAVLTNIYAQ